MTNTKQPAERADLVAWIWKSDLDDFQNGEGSDPSPVFRECPNNAGTYVPLYTHPAPQSPAKDEAGEVPRPIINEWWKQAQDLDHITNIEFMQHVAQRAIAWDRHQRAQPSPDAATAVAQREPPAEPKPTCEGRKLTRREIDRIAAFAIESNCLPPDQWESAGLYDFAHAIVGGIGVVDDLATLVSRLVRALKKLNPDHYLAVAALGYLKRHGLEGSPLRAQPTGAAEVERTGPFHISISGDHAKVFPQAGIADVVAFADWLDERLNCGHAGKAQAQSTQAMAEGRDG